MDWEGLLEGATAIVRDTFGEPFTYVRHSDGHKVEPVTAIFDPDFVEMAGNGAQQMAARMIVVEVRDSDIGGEPKLEDRFTRHKTGITYRVSTPMPSSSGMTKVQLRKV